MNLFIDIETIPCQHNFDAYLQEEIENFKAPSGLTKAKACEDLGLTGDKAKYTGKDDAIRMWEEKFGAEKAPEVAEEKWRKTSFDASQGEIISIAWALNDGEAKSVIRTLDESEAGLLSSFFEQVNKDILSEDSHSAAIHYVGHYISGFDLRFIFQRCVINGVRPLFKIPHAGRHGKDYYDTMIGWCGFKDRISQDNLCKALGIEGKPSDIDGSKVWDFIKDGKYSEVEEYNKDDVVKARKIYNRLTFNQQEQ